MLTDLLQKIKSFLKENQRDLYLASLVFLVSVASFGLGRLSVIWPEKEPIRIENQELGIMNQESGSNISNPNSSSVIPNSTAGRFVASRNGSAYHLPECPGAKQIKEENKIWFATAEEARAAGYKPAGNCAGLQP
ncbi:MAG: Ada metal-binding domain-containing protein [Patescibacteria group bacterium]